SLEGADLLAGVDVPKLDGSVDARRRQVCGLWAERQALDPRRMPFEDLHDLAGRKVPYLDPLLEVVRGAGVQLAVRSEGGEDDLRTVGKDGQLVGASTDYAARRT